MNQHPAGTPRATKTPTRRCPECGGTYDPRTTYDGRPSNAARVACSDPCYRARRRRRRRTLYAYHRANVALIAATRAEAAGQLPLPGCRSLPPLPPLPATEEHTTP